MKPNVVREFLTSSDYSTAILLELECLKSKEPSSAQGESMWLTADTWRAIRIAVKPHIEEQLRKIDEPPAARGAKERPQGHHFQVRLDNMIIVGIWRQNNYGHLRVITGQTKQNVYNKKLVLGAVQTGSDSKVHDIIKILYKALNIPADSQDISQYFSKSSAPS